MSLAKALLEFQRNAPQIPRDQENPHFKSRFASLEVVVEKIRPVLVDCGLVVTQFPTRFDDGQPGLRTVVWHAESGESLEDTMPLFLKQLDAQGQGAALTYAKRQALLAVLGLVADDDDDGNSAKPKRKREGAAGKPAPSDPKRDLMIEQASDLIAEYAKVMNLLPHEAAKLIREHCEQKYGKLSRASMDDTELEKLVFDLRELIEAGKLPF